MKNELTKLLGIEVPVIQGGMMEISRSGLTAAVSNAGGLGTLGQRFELEAWHEDLKKTKELTDKPFSVNLPLHTPELEKKLDIILDEGVKVVTTAAGNPSRILGPLKEAGITVMHVVANLEQAKKVEAAGVDGIVAEGGESGGMVAKDRVSTIVLIPEVTKAVKVPVVAAGGIAEARGLVAALALGAQGVQIGTRLIASVECEAPQEWKEAVVKARDVDTMIVPRGKAQGRILKEELISGAMAGIVSGLIDSIETVDEIISKMVVEAEKIADEVNVQIKA